MNTIVGKGYVNIRDEKLAGGAITPGMLVKRNSADKVVVHSTPGGPASPLFALEDENQGRDIDDAYAADELVKLWKPVSGEQVLAIVDDNTGSAIDIGDFVESAGDGRVRKVTDNSAQGSTFPIGVALEAVAPGSAGTRILIEIL
jgi:hypothetical protein